MNIFVSVDESEKTKRKTTNKEKKEPFGHALSLLGLIQFVSFFRLYHGGICSIIYLASIVFTTTRT